MSSLETAILVLFKSDKNLELSKIIFSSLKLFPKLGKFSGGRHSKLKSEFDEVRLILFSVFKSNLTDES